MHFLSITHKQLKESNIEDLLVQAGLIAQLSVVQHSHGGHYNRAIKLYKLFYEFMLCIITHGREKKFGITPLPQ